MIIPRGRTILVKPDPEQDRVSESGIVTPDSVELERKAIGTVIALSSWRKLWAFFGSPVRVGAKVLYGVYVGESAVDTKTKEEFKLLYVSFNKDNEVLAFIR